MDLVLALLLFAFLLAFFGWAVWISYLVVFRGWRITGPPPPTSANPSSGKENPPRPRPRRSGRK